jgi:hypothetical protein
MQPDPDCLLILSEDAKAFILGQRPELAAAFTDQTVSLDALLTPAANPVRSAPMGQPLSYPSRLGDRLASALQRVGVAALVHRLVRGRDCGCSARQAWLNRHGGRIEAAAWLLTALLWLIVLLK